MILLTMMARDKSRKFGIKFGKNCDKTEKIWNQKRMSIWFSLITTRVHLLLSNQVNKCILNICKAHNISFINNDIEMQTHHPHVPIHVSTYHLFRSLLFFKS